MTHKIKILGIGAILIVAILGWMIVYFYYQNLRGVWAAVKTPTINITTDTTSTAGSLFKLPAGFSIEVLAKNLPGARVLIFDNQNNIWLSQTGPGLISKLTIKNGQVNSTKTILSGLRSPHGLAFDPADPNALYIAEETKISKAIITTTGTIKLQKIIDLPPGGRHYTRTLGFGPDGRLYVSIGSTCNVCNENDARYAAIYSLNKDGSDWRPVAKGLRNSVFFVFNSKDKKIWATEMGRDYLGDDNPPDEINIIDTTRTTTLNFGWPICYGKNIHDTSFDKKTYIRNPCLTPFEIPSFIDIPAHSAPLGLAFVPTSSTWPQEYQNNLLVALHGSWNRTAPTGYKIVRFVLDNNGNFIQQQDFITGWLTPQGSFGRPVDVVFDKTGALYITDDKAGTIYKVTGPN